MPKPFQYRSGSLIYFQGDAADKVFILQKGAVSLVYQDIETGQDVHDLVQPGEFFGVKSALGHYAREENAVTLADTTTMAFTVPEFEALAMANTRIIMKMLKVFSNQMRRIHRQVSSLMEKEEVNPETGLFNVGEYHLKNKRFSQAKYVFSRYLTY
jgi:CRP-like cAMP-binding protein